MDTLGASVVDHSRYRRQRFRSREVQLSAVEDLLRAVHAGRGGAMVVCGAAGIGKTALLDQALETIPQARRLDVAGEEFETELPFTALHELCVPLLGGLDSLPDPQRAALEVAFAVREGAHSYVVCTKDRAVPEPLQRRFIREIDAISHASTRVTELDSGHLPFLSCPSDLSEAIAAVW